MRLVAIKWGLVGPPHELCSTAIERLRSLEQHPTSSDELVAALRTVAAMGVGERSRCDQQAACAGFDLSLLMEKLGLAFGKAIIEVDRP